MTLTQMRENAGLSMRQMAERMGLGSTFSRIGAWEQWGREHPSKSAKDPRNMSLYTARRAADALGISLDEFERNL